MWNVTVSNEEICYNIHTIAYSLIKINIDLSNEGKRHVKEILDTIFSYINLLKKKGPQKKFTTSLIRDQKIFLGKLILEIN